MLLPPALHGCGLLLAPDYLVEDHIKAGRLVRIMPDYTTHETPVYAVYPSRNPSAKTRTFVDFLAARFGRSNGADHGEIKLTATRFRRRTSGCKGAAKGNDGELIRAPLSLPSMSIITGGGG